MAQSLSKIYLHVIFSTKNRKAFLQDATLRSDCHQYLGGICRNLDSTALAVGGVADHVHILCRMSRSLSVADFVLNVKKDSSKWVKAKEQSLGDFHWQNGYAAFSISPSHVEALRRYIVDQEKHHQKESFQDELRRILRKYDVEYDERYVWD